MALASNAAAVGYNANASGLQSTAVGNGAQALGAQSTALGVATKVASSASGSTAIGYGATASLPNQMVFGTADTTYTAPGMNSDLSRARQNGLLGVVTSDDYGNLASDNGALYREVARVKSETAVSMALADPILADDQRFGVKVNWGGFEGANAVGVTASGVMGKDLITRGDRLMLSGGAGWGQSSVNDYSERVVGGHAGMQFAW